MSLPGACRSGTVVRTHSRLSPRGSRGLTSTNVNEHRAAARHKESAAATPDKPAAGAERRDTPRTRAVVNKALAFLARLQCEDGSFGGGKEFGRTAVTAVCGMALLEAGNRPD